MRRNSRDYVITRRIDNLLLNFYEAYMFMGRFFREAFRGPLEFQELVKQCYQIGYRSLPLISLTGFITGMVFTKQSRPSLMEFGATSWLPSLVSIAIVRALAPLITSLISAGKVGSSIGAELGSMRVTEQIDAMEVSAVNPFKFLVVTRVLASTISIPILSFYCAFVGLMGSFLDVTLNEETNIVAFFEKAFEQITFLDIGSALFKAIAYGFTIGMVGCYKGYNATQGTQGVGKAANASVVLSMFLIFLEEVAIVQITNWMR
ncbi:ABC transporter permease [Rhabdobacter roseus]|uniref:Phospholipid/cholesterol/gamma-HCH transport system permease protein n=1 Tax=Rhabdobacter roseus TaxID=1655419 RepID=A0A840U3J3_9BACT|nr:ABC transporter permease [Rhabdobacter roseus]MBB5286898.1 phospholipid/cholesterol/gamma-HCH transport system permease protein [Rhabdobacter roseus]